MLKNLASWRLGGLTGALIMMFAVACGVAASPDGAGTGDAASQQQEGAGQQQPAAREILVNGSLVFPRRIELTFGTGGEVGEILVQEGDRVTQGQVLARLNDLGTTTLETELAQAKFDRDAAERSLQAEFEDQAANARQALKDAEDKLNDFQRNHQSELTQAMKAEADAEKGLDDADKSLSDFQLDYQQTLATKMQDKAKAEDKLDEVLRNVGDFDRDRVQELADARQVVADTELALKIAREDLTNFDANYEESLHNAIVARDNAQKALDDAEDDLQAFLINPLATRDLRDNGTFDLVVFDRLKAGVDKARINLSTAENSLADFRNKKDLLLVEAQSAVPQAEATLIKARDDVTKLERDVDRTLSLQMRQADYEDAQAKLAQAEVELQREVEGPDQLILQQLRAAVESAQANLAQAEVDLQREMDGPDQAELAVREKGVALARKKLEDLIAPDSFDVALRQAKLAAAQAKVDDASENVEGATIKAPIDGVIALVNVEVEDNVNDESRVLEIIDPTEVEVDGLVDAIDIQFVEAGAAARVTIASLPGEKFEGTVIRVADEPRTERGVVSYPVRIAIDLPEGFQVPVRLTAVTAVILY